MLLICSLILVGKWLCSHFGKEVSLFINSVLPLQQTEVCPLDLLYAPCVYSLCASPSLLRGLILISRSGHEVAHTEGSHMVRYLRFGTAVLSATAASPLHLSRQLPFT